MEKQLAERVSNVLETTGARQIAANYLPGKLEESGWNKRIFDECVKWLKDNTASGQRVCYGQKIREEFREPEDVDTNELIEPLLKVGMQLISPDVCKYIEEYFIKVIKENITNC